MTLNELLEAVILGVQAGYGDTQVRIEGCDCINAAKQIEIVPKDETSLMPRFHTPEYVLITADLT
jgi:hypothetical protein